LEQGRSVFILRNQVHKLDGMDFSDRQLTALEFRTTCPQWWIERSSQSPSGTHCEPGAYLFNGRKLIVIKEPEELSGEMEIDSQTEATFPEFDRSHRSNIVNRYHFPTSIFLPILITHILQFEL
jgi:hypothetical protein